MTCPEASLAKTNDVLYFEAEYSSADAASKTTGRLLSFSTTSFPSFA